MTGAAGHVELRGVQKSFGSFTAISDLDLAIPKGEFCALLGPSGCGKSTLLRLIAGLEGVSAGRIFIDGQDVTKVHPSKRAIAMVFQSYALYPHMSVRENIGFSLEVAGLPKAERAKRATEVGALLQLGPMLDRRPAQLSGGQRQRVAIGRALVRDPQVFLFDEPLSNLDAKLRVQMRLELSNLHQQLATTMIYVTHDQVEAMTMADRIVVLDHGRIMQVGAPLELYGQPANKFVASFIGAPAMNFLPVLSAAPEGETLVLKAPGIAPIAVASPKRAARPVAEIGVRPEHVVMLDPGAKDAIANGQVALIERLGNSSIVHLRTEAGQISVQGGGDLVARIGDTVGFAIDAERLHLFDGDGNTL